MKPGLNHARFQPTLTPKKALQLVGPAFASGLVLAAALAQGFVKLFEQFLLVLGEFDGCFDGDVAIQIARMTAAHTLNAFAAQAELLAGLGALGDVDGGFAA